MRDSIRQCTSLEDCSLFGYKRYSNVLIEIFYCNPLEMPSGSFRLRAGSNSPTWLKPVALLPLFGRLMPGNCQYEEETTSRLPSSRAFPPPPHKRMCSIPTSVDVFVRCGRMPTSHKHIH